MPYEKFLEEVIERGKVGVIRDYHKPHQIGLKKGSLAGFEACRGLSPKDLRDLMTTSRGRIDWDTSDDNSHWYGRGFNMEVEWVCNVVSAMLLNEGKPVIIQPTARAVMLAAEILGVKES